MATPPVISKTTYTFSVLHRTDDPPESLDEALYRATDGHAVGDINPTAVTVTVPDDQVAAELVALGNDGSFFDDDLDEAAEDPTRHPDQEH